MNNDFQIVDSDLFIQMPKEIDHHESIRLRERADNYIERKHINTIVFDFQNTVFMDSSGIGVIVGRYKKISLLGGNIKAIHVNERIKKIFMISGLYKIVDISDDCIN